MSATATAATAARGRLHRHWLASAPASVSPAAAFARVSTTAVGAVHHRLGRLLRRRLAAR